jgi:hypothetical protein
MHLSESGSMIGDNAVLAYLNMLANQELRLRRVATQFLPTLKEQGWQFVSCWMRDTGMIGNGWESARLIFIPGFLGPSTAGHWLPIIIDRQVEPGITIVIIGDSLGPSNFEEVQGWFRNTPFQGATFQYLDIPRQAAGSNDCAGFMLLVFSAWLRPSNGKSMHMRLESCCAKEFGQNGRKHILESIENGRVVLNGDPVVSLTFE